MSSLTTPPTAFTALFCATLEELGTIPLGAPLPDVVQTVNHHPKSVLRSIMGKGERPLNSLWGFHHIKLRSVPHVEIPSEVEAAFEDLFVDRGLSEEASIRRYFEKIAGVLAQGIELFQGKGPEVPWQKVFIAERLLAEDLETPLSAGQRAFIFSFHAPNYALIDFEERAALLFQTALDEIRGIKGEWNLSETLGRIAIHLVEAGMGEKAAPLFERMIEEAAGIEEEECRQKTLRNITRSLPPAELGKNANALFERLTEAAQKIRDEGYRRLVLDAVSDARATCFRLP